MCLHHHFEDDKIRFDLNKIDETQEPNKHYIIGKRKPQECNTSPALNLCLLHSWWGRWPHQDSSPGWPGARGCSPVRWWCWCQPRPPAGAWPPWSGPSPRPRPGGSGRQSHGGSGQGSAEAQTCCFHSILKSGIFLSNLQKTINSLKSYR